MGKPTTKEPKTPVVEAETPVQPISYTAAVPEENGDVYAISFKDKYAEGVRLFLQHNVKDEDKDQYKHELMYMGADILHKGRIVVNNLSGEGAEANLDNPATVGKIIDAFKAVAASGGVSLSEARSLSHLADVISKPAFEKHAFDAADIQSIDDAAAQVITNANPAKPVHAK